MSWILLFSALLLEVAATSQLKLSEGFTDVGYSLGTVMLFALSCICAAIACKKIDLMVRGWYS